MRELQSRIIEEMGVKPQIDPAEEVAARVGFLKDYLRATGTRGFVLGISGGVDSSLAGRLAQLAVEELAAEGVEADFVAMRLPYGEQHDEEDAQAAMGFVAAKREVTFNVKPGVDGLEGEYEQTTGTDLSDFSKGNIKARARMIAQYAMAGEHNLLVIGTDHGAESVTGFFTKHGDGGADVLPLFGLNKRQNLQLLQHLGAPERVWQEGPHRGPARHPSRPHRRGRTRAGVRRDRRLPGGPRHPGRGRREDRAEVPAHPPQAHRPRDHPRHLVALTPDRKTGRKRLL